MWSMFFILRFLFLGYLFKISKGIILITKDYDKDLKLNQFERNLFYMEG